MHELERLQKNRKSQPLARSESKPAPATRPQTHFEHPTSDHAYSASATSALSNHSTSS
jgi:hypothetical protein